jgi:HD superfamily phosphohydrolase
MLDKALKYFDKKQTNPKFEREISNLLGENILATSYMTDLKGKSRMGLVYIFESVPDGYVYNRYDHTLSVAHLTLRLCNRLAVPKVETKLAVLAALCHDLGHGPFSHSSEGYLRWKSGTRRSHQYGTHYTKIASMLHKCATALPKDLVEPFTTLEAVAKATYYVTQGTMPRDWDESSAVLVGLICPMFDGPLSADVIDGDNRAFLSLSHLTKFRLIPCDSEALIDVVSSYDEMFVVDGIYGMPLVKKYMELQGRFYDRVIQTKKLEAGEAMLARALELAYKERKSRVGYSNLTDKEVKAKFTLDPKSNSAKLWNDLEAVRLFVPLSDKDPDLYNRACKAFPIQDMSLDAFKNAKELLEKKLAQKLGEHPDFVIAQVLQPLSWKADNIQFVPLKTIGSKTPLQTKIIWDDSQGMPLQENKRLEIYVPAS